MRIHPDSPNKEAIPLVEVTISEHEVRTRQLLPELPEDLQIYVYDENIIPEKGVGGYAFNLNILSLAVDNDFADKDLQRRALADTMLHEGYHIVQGHTGEKPHAPRGNALHSSIYEGAATKFEIAYGIDGDAPWGDYSAHNEEELSDWRDKLEAISHEEWLADDGKLWQRWSFYDHEDNQRWKSYKVGAWIVDDYLVKTGKDIRDLRLMSAEEILSNIGA